MLLSEQYWAYAGQRMDVTGLTVSERSAGLSRIKRSSVRGLVHQSEDNAQIGSDSPLLGTMKRRAASLVGQYSLPNPEQGKLLKQRLKALSK